MSEVSMTFLSSGSQKPSEDPESAIAPGQSNTSHWMSPDDTCALTLARSGVSAICTSMPVSLVNGSTYAVWIAFRYAPPQDINEILSAALALPGLSSSGPPTAASAVPVINVRRVTGDRLPVTMSAIV